MVPPPANVKPQSGGLWFGFAAQHEAPPPDIKPDNSPIQENCRKNLDTNEKKYQHKLVFD